jgi:predicted Rdx family selenoprotein
VERARLEVADIFRHHGAAYRAAHETSLSSAQRRVMQAIETCRTAALGGHVEQCDACQHQRIAYNSCRNRHCPKCQSLARAAWIEQRLLSLGLFHRQFLKIIRSRFGPYSHIKRTGGIALEDGGIWEGGEARSEV